MIAPFNLAWFLLIVLQFGLPVVIARCFKNKTRQEKLAFVKWFSIASAVIWVIYKFGLYLDPNFEFEFWDELPLQPCNTMLWLAVIACCLDNEFIMDYGFYIGIPCAMMALMMPEIGFFDIPVFSIRSIGYYGTHAFVVMLGMFFVLFGLTEVNYKSALRSVLFFVFMACSVHVINLLLRATVHPEATYYYTFGFEQNFLLSAFMRFIPVPLLYMAPIFLITYGVVMLETFIIRLFRKRKTA